jgi:hypothetical protein
MDRRHNDGYESSESGTSGSTVEWRSSAHNSDHEREEEKNFEVIDLAREEDAEDLLRSLERIKSELDFQCRQYFQTSIQNQMLIRTAMEKVQKFMETMNKK